MLVSRWIPQKNDAGQLYFSALYRALPRLNLGFDYRPLVDQVGGIATWHVLPESEGRPALLFSTANDDFEEGGREINSQHFSFVASKAFGNYGGVVWSPYAGAAYIYELGELRPVAGLSARREEILMMLQFSGTNTHVSASYDLTDDLAASFILWGMEFPGAALRLRF